MLLAPRYANGDHDHSRSVVGGTILRGAFLSAQWQAITLLGVPALTAMGYLVCSSIDASVWRAERMCDMQASCAELDGVLLPLCDSMDADMTTLLWFYRGAIPLSITDIVFLVTFLMAHHTKGMPVLSTFDVYTVERGVAGAAFWAFLLATNCVRVAACVYRYLILPIRASEYELALYPDSLDSTGVALAACTISFATAGFMVALAALVSRVRMLRRAEVLVVDKQETETLLKTGEELQSIKEEDENTLL